MHAVLPYLEGSDFPPVTRGSLDTLQVNVGYRCNQACLHCHVGAGPNRTEEMGRETLEDVLAFLEASEATTLDVTGGAPELSPHFRELVARARDLGARVIDRCNLTVLEEPEMEELPGFLAAQGAEVVASLPCYRGDNVDAQRGTGVFDASIRGLRRLNAAGYGHPHSGLELSLVFNPQGPALPPDQGELEAAYRQRLWADHGIRFTRLLALANMPISRFGSTLVSQGRLGEYLEALKAAHHPGNLAGLMCRSLLSVDWQGRVYDCDFNQMLGLPLPWPDRDHPRLRDLLGRDLAGRPVAVRAHCYGCTAGQGSGCGGALA